MGSGGFAKATCGQLWAIWAFKKEDTTNATLTAQEEDNMIFAG